MDRGWAVLAAVAALALAQAALPLATAKPLPTHDLALTLPDAFVFQQATFLSGHLALDPARLANVTLVGASSLALPPGVLRACPPFPTTGAEDAAPPAPSAPTAPGGGPLPGQEDGCQDGRDFEDAEVAFGPGTQVRFLDPLEVVRFPAASLSVLVSQPQGGANATRTVWGAVLGSDGMEGRPALDRDGPAAGGANATLRFAPLGRTSATEVTTPGEGAARYNGTGWSFEFRPRGGWPEGGAALGLHGQGLLAHLPATFGLRLDEAPTHAARDALDARVLLDVQREALGADAREPLRNLTAALSGFRLAPWMARGALLGSLDGALGSTAFPAGAPSALRLRSLTAEVDGAALRGDAEAVFAVTPQGFAEAGRGAASPPWLLIAGAMGLAVAAHALHRARGGGASFPGVALPLGAALALAAFLAWDAIVRGVLGTSGLALWADGEPAGSVAGLLAFEGAAFALGWALLQVPVGFAAQRALHDRLPEDRRRLAPWLGAVAGAALFLAYAWLDPASLLALGHLVARL